MLMGNKFYIINNGLKDLYGHYFETAVSVAEAARDLGWTPLLATHYTCPKDLVPSWLAFHPVLHTDHWMPGRLRSFKRIVRNLLPESLHEVARAGARLSKNWLGKLSRNVGVLSKTFGHDGEVNSRLALDLEQIGSGEETAYLSLFQKELTSLLKTTQCGPSDHVFVPTAHGRELIAIQRMVADWEPERLPTFHLEFRHDLDVYGSTYREQHRVYFQHAREFSKSDRLRLYSDTSELSASFERFSGLRFDTLPIPFRSQLIQPAPPSDQIRISYFGDARDEKGFYWLPDLVDSLLDNYLRSGRVSFIIQATRSPTSHSRRSRRALEQLWRYDSKYFRFVGEESPLQTEEYYRLVSETDILLCPYDAARYRMRSSGTFTEGISAGVPVVCPADTWMSTQLPPGGGEKFADKQSFINAVKRICDQYPAYRERAQKYKIAWNECHSPTKLVRTIIGQAK